MLSLDPELARVQARTSDFPMASLSRILLVLPDDAADREALLSVLRQRGVDVDVSAGDAVEAKLRERHDLDYDCVLVDQRLTRSEGLVRDIRASSDGVAAVLLTSDKRQSLDSAESGERDVDALPSHLVDSELIDLLVRRLARERSLEEDRRRAEEELRRLKANFLSTLSYDLRAPMAGLMGALRLLEAAKAVAAGEHKHMLAIAARNGERVTEILNEIVDVEKLEQGKASMELRVFDLTEAAEAAIVEIQDKAADQGSAVALRTEPRRRPVFGDRGRVRRAIDIYLENALLNSAKGEDVELRLDTDGAMHKVSVIDHGAVLPSKYHVHAFDTFGSPEVWGARSRTSSLSLAIVRATMDMLGGQVGLAELGDGRAAFWFELPEAVS